MKPLSIIRNIFHSNSNNNQSNNTQNTANNSEESTLRLVRRSTRSSTAIPSAPTTSETFQQIQAGNAQPETVSLAPIPLQHAQVVHPITQQGLTSINNSGHAVSSGTLAAQSITTVRTTATTPHQSLYPSLAHTPHGV